MLFMFGPWQPDLTALDAGCVEATNVVPGVGSYEPQQELSAFTGALETRCQGAIAVGDAIGAVYWFAGDATKLYTINTNTVTWSNVSRVGLYSTQPGDVWSFARYGNGIYAANYSDDMQVYSLGVTNVFLDLDGGSPRARYLNVVKNFLVAVNTNGVDGPTPQRVQWAGLDLPGSWTVDATTLADFQDLLGDGGANQGILVGLTQSDAVILQERAVWRMTYVGLPLVFSFDKVEGVRGTPAPGSVIAVGGVAYYLGEDGFYAFDGSQSLAIGQGRINRTFAADADPNLLHRMSTTLDVRRKLIFWAYASNSAVAGCPDRILVFNWSTGQWSRLNIETELLWRTLSLGYTLEELDAFGTVDTIGVSFDSQQWGGGSIQQMSAFDPQHKTAHFSGANLGASLTTKEFTVPEPTRMLLREVWPIINAQTTAIKTSIGHRAIADDSVSFAAAVSMNPVGFCPQRTADHYIRVRISISSSTVWEQATGVDVKFAPVGWR